MRRPPGATELDDCGQMKRSTGKARSPPRGVPPPPPRSRTSRRDGSRDSCLAELLAQLVLGPHQVFLAGRGQAFARTIDIEREHGQRGAKCAGLAAPAFFSRPFQGRCNPLGIARRENALVGGERIAVLGPWPRPAPACPSSPRRAAVAGACFPAGTPFARLARRSFPRHCITMPQYASCPLNAPVEALFRGRL